MDRVMVVTSACVNHLCPPVHTYMYMYHMVCEIWCDSLGVWGGGQRKNWESKGCGEMQ